MKKVFKRSREFLRRKGLTLIELLGVMAVVAIISAIAVGGITSARDAANETSVSSDIRTYQTAIQQVLVQHPEVMKFTANKPAKAASLFVEYLNSQLEELWKFEMLDDNADSGAIAGSAIKRDAWNNPYGLYIYFDDLAPKYTDGSNKALTPSDSCVYIVVCSAGKNSTGGPMGIDGANYKSDTRKITSTANMINNTDGVDDIGSIIRILNGDVYAATFGFDNATLGTLKGIQWIYGIPKESAGGINYDFAASGPGVEKTAATAGSLDKYYDSQAIAIASPQPITLVGTWNQ